jgi:nucleoid-associated protein YgaU
MTTTVTTTALPTRAVGPSIRSARVVRPARPIGPRTRSRAVRCETSVRPDLLGSRLTPRGRLVVAVMWLVLAIIAAVPFLRAGEGRPDQVAVRSTVVVEPGDTLWGLAREIDAAADPRPLVAAIVELNGLRSGAEIQPGDVLVVPGR